MTKYFSIVLFSCLICLCSCSKRTINYCENCHAKINYIELTPDSTSYNVIDIIKKNSWYFIYLQRNDSIFKVVSHEPSYKVPYEGYRKIEKDKRYNLILHAYSEIHRVDGVSIWPIGYTGGVQLDSITTVSVEPENDIWDLYEADELVGLYYLKAL